MSGKQKLAKVERSTKNAHDEKNAEIAKQKKAKNVKIARIAKNAKHEEVAEFVKKAKTKRRQGMQNPRKSRDCQYCNE